MESTNTPPRQTLSYLTGLLASRRIRPNSKLGQNLLIDLNLMDLVVSSAQLNSDDMVLEVGCGTGSLTSRLVGQAGFVLGVEIDFSMADLAQEVVGSRENFSLIQCDVLAGKNKIRDEVLVQLEQQKTKHQLKQIKLVANLPFAVATPVIANLLINSLPIHLMVVMVQWEIGQKMASLPGGPDFGALSILVQSLAQVEILRKIPATAFWPKPKVDSAIVRITPHNQPLTVEGATRELTPKNLRGFLRDLYSHRRKNLRGGLLAMQGRNWTKKEVDEKLLKIGIPGEIRAETLDVATHLKLWAQFDDGDELGNS